MLILSNGSDLTNKDVYVRNLYMNGKQKASPIERNDLSKDERKLYGAARSSGSNDPDVDKIFYDFTDQRNGAGIVSNKFDGQIFEYREAEKRIPVIKDLHQSFSGGVFAFTGIADIVGSGVKNGTLTLDYPGGEKILKLLKDIKEDGGIKTAEITLTSSVSGASLEEFAAYKRGLEYAGKQYQALFNKAGVKNVRINVNALRDQPGGSGGIDIKLKR
ncbi:hypothetical protein GO495_02255 [Chitinophaga oryziterrae]|uniref:Uncharacterized protein n=1 Tax=Chitinophaga oryziterrae TaxID=1031224 RepID=A0A6N8J547_9BACT|nr:hypothetical protein [Chitinophaga oryziterrae]MVT39396.1 hypothetical protein [Chitinophaga oryziterrae]